MDVQGGGRQADGGGSQDRRSGHDEHVGTRLLEAAVRFGRVNGPDRKDAIVGDADPGTLVQLSLGELPALAENELAVQDKERLVERVDRTVTAAVAHEQPAPELLLEPLDLLGERGLADEQPRCRTAEVKFLGDGDEVAHHP